MRTFLEALVAAGIVAALLQVSWWLDPLGIRALPAWLDPHGWFTLFPDSGLELEGAFVLGTLGGCARTTRGPPFLRALLRATCASVAATIGLGVGFLAFVCVFLDGPLSWFGPADWLEIATRYAPTFAPLAWICMMTTYCCIEWRRPSTTPMQLTAERGCATVSRS